MDIIELKSYAKINLGLQVLNKRPDHFHNINTIFARINLFDEIIIEKNNSNNINLKIIGNEFLNQSDEIDNNLIVKAFNKIKKILRDKNKIRDKDSDSLIGVDVTLKKNIPIGAGLGGGSSNAAYFILGFVKLFKIILSKAELSVIAQSLGSDISYFLQEGFAIAKSRGEKLLYFEHDFPFNIVLIYPNLHINTTEAYKKFNRETFDQINQKQNLYNEINFYEILVRSEQNHSLLKEFIVNDFEQNAIEQYPIIKQIKDELYNQNAILALMSGSGSTIFGLFDKKDNVSDKIQKLTEKYGKHGFLIISC